MMSNENVRTIKVKLQRVLEAEIEVPAPDHLTDEIDWYEAVESLAWYRQARFGSWSTADEKVVELSDHFTPNGSSGTENPNA